MCPALFDTFTTKAPHLMLRKYHRKNCGKILINHSTRKAAEDFYHIYDKNYLFIYINTHVISAMCHLKQDPNRNNTS